MPDRPRLTTLETTGPVEPLVRLASNNPDLVREVLRRPWPETLETVRWILRSRAPGVDLSVVWRVLGLPVVRFRIQGQSQERAENT